MKLRGWHALALISIVLLAVYYPVLSAPLNSVDDVMLVNDLLNRSNFTWHDLFFPTSKSYYRPLVNISFIADCFLWNMETSFLHLENLLLHWVNAITLFFLVRQVTIRLNLEKVYTPFAAALLFGIHPINTEAVIWVAGRADLLATFFILLVLICALKYLETNSFSWIICTIILFFIGCLAKETVLFVWPGLLLLGYQEYRSRREGETPNHLSLWQSMRPSLACMISISSYFLLRDIALHGRDLGLRQVENIISHTVASGHVSTAAVDFLWLNKLERGITIAGFYARKIIQPFPLNFGIIEVSDFYFWLGLLMILLCLYALINLSWARVFFLTAVSLGSIALLVAYGGISWTPVAERYMYAPTALASGGVALSAALLLPGQSLYKQRGAFLLVCLMVSIGAFGVYQRALVWKDNVTLFEDTVRKSPRFQTAHNELAMALMKKGEHERAYAILRDLDVPDFQAASLNKVLVWIHDGEYVKARNFLIERLKRPGAYDRLVLERLVGVLRLMSQNTDSQAEVKAFDEEVLHYLDDLWRRTREPLYLYSLGRQQMMMGRRSAARLSFAEANRLFPEGSIYKQPAGKLAETLK